MPLVLTTPLSPLPRRHGLRVSPQALLPLSRILLQPFEYRIPWHILPIPSAPTVFDQLMIDVGAIRQKHIGKGAPILVLAMGLARDLLPIDESSRGLPGLFAEGLAFLRAIDAAEADAFGFVFVQDFDGVAVEDRDDGAGEVRREYD